MIDFPNAKNIVTPKGEIALITRGAEVLWRKQKYKRELAYLESTGTQWINTGITATNNTGVSVKYRYIAHGSAAICGIYQGNAPRTDVLFVSSYSGLTSSILHIAHRGRVFTGGEITLNTDYHCKINYLNDNLVYFDDTVAGEVGQNGTVNAPIPLFARLNANNQNITASNSRIYYAKFTEGNALVRDFIPVLDWNDRPCMYDKVTDELFYNQGTGEFLYAEKAVA